MRGLLEETTEFRRSMVPDLQMPATFRAQLYTHQYEALRWTVYREKSNLLRGGFLGKNPP